MAYGWAPDSPGSALPIALLPDYPLMIIMSYLQGIYKPPSGPSWQPTPRNWRNRSKLVISSSLDPDWYKPLGPVTGVPFTAEVFELLEHNLRWTSLSALRLTCKRFAILSTKVVPLFSLLQQLRLGYIPLSSTSTGLTTSDGYSGAERRREQLPLATVEELRMVERSTVTSGILKPQLFRDLFRDEPSSKTALLPLESKSSSPSSSTKSSSLSPSSPTSTSSNDSYEHEDEFNPTLSSENWYGMMAMHVHRSFCPLVIPPPHEAPLAALQIVITAQRHLAALKQAAISPVSISLTSNTWMDYYIGGEWRKKLEEDCETHVRFRLKIQLKSDAPDSEPHWLHFKSIVTQSTSFVRPRNAEDITRDPLNLSPFFVRKSTTVAMRLPFHVGLHILSVQTDDPILAAALGLPSSPECSTIIMMIENGAKGILEPHTRENANVFPPVTLQRQDFFTRLVQLLEFPSSNSQEMRESLTGVQYWLSAISLVDYPSTPNPMRKHDLDRMYSYPFLTAESPVFGPLAPSNILNPHTFILDGEIGRFLNLFLQHEPESSNSVSLPRTHLMPLSLNLITFYFKSLDIILEQYRRNHIVLPVLEKRAKREFERSLHGPISTLLKRSRLSDQVEVDFQVLGTPDTKPMELVPVAMYSSFEFETDDPKILIRFTHRRYPMAISISIVAPSALEAWQWATKHRFLLNYFHYGCTPFFVPMPDLSHLSKRHMEVTSVTLIPTVPGAPQASWTSDPLVTNSALASTSVNGLEDLEVRDGICIFRWDPSMPLEDWRKQASTQNIMGLPLDLHLMETLSVVLGVPELGSHELMSIITRVFGQTMGHIPEAPGASSFAKAFKQHHTTMQQPHQSEPLLRQASDSAVKTESFAPISNESISKNSTLSTSSTNSESSENGASQSQFSSFNSATLKKATPTSSSYDSPYTFASVLSPSKLSNPIGTTRVSWKPTLVSESASVTQTTEPHASYVSISMMPQYAHLTPEQLRWADYNIAHPEDFGIIAKKETSEKSPTESYQRIHPSNVFVDPAVVAQYPNSSHEIYFENGTPYVVFMGSGDKFILIQLIKSRALLPFDEGRIEDEDAAVEPNEKIPSLRNSRSDLPVYPTSTALVDPAAPEMYSVLWRRTQTAWVVTTPCSDVSKAKTIFASKFSLFTGQAWSLDCHVRGWKVSKLTGRTTWDSETLEGPEVWSQPTFLGQPLHYEHINLTSYNELLRCMAPISETLRYWARYYRLIQADLSTCLSLIQWALLNDEAGTEDRVLSLMEYSELTRTCGDVEATLEAVNAANLADTTHPLPWLAKADLLHLASLQTLDTRVELSRIDQSLVTYRRFLHFAHRAQTLAAQLNPRAFRDIPGEVSSSGSDEKSLGKDSGSGSGGNQGGWAGSSGSSSNPSSLAAQTPSVAPPNISHVMLTRNPLVANVPTVPSLVHMRRARWACGRLLQRLGRYDDAKACFDDLLRKYFKRERLELTLERGAVLLALGRPKEAAETIEHALKKENSATSASGIGVPGGAGAGGPGGPGGTTVPFPSLYAEHTTTLKARALLLLAAAHVRNSSIDLAVAALRDHKRLDPFDPRAAVIEKIIRRSRHTSKADSRTRLRQHGMHVFQQMARGNPINPAPGNQQPGPQNPANVAPVAGAQAGAPLAQAAHAQAGHNLPMPPPMLMGGNGDGDHRLNDFDDGAHGGVMGPPTLEIPAHGHEGNMMEVAVGPLHDREDDGDILASSLDSSIEHYPPPLASSSSSSMGASQVASSSNNLLGSGTTAEDGLIVPRVAVESASPLTLPSPSVVSIALPSSSSSFSNILSVASPSTPSSSNALSNTPASVPSLSSSLALRRTYYPRQFAQWELFGSLIESMVDFSSMANALLPSTLFQPDCDSSRVYLSTEALLTSIRILETIRELMEEAALPPSSSRKSPEQIADLISQAEERYFRTMPQMRRHHVSFFIVDELRRLNYLMDAVFACKLLQEACMLEKSQQTLPSPHRSPLSSLSSSSSAASSSSSSSPSTPPVEEAIVSFGPNERPFAGNLVSRIVRLQRPTSETRLFATSASLSSHYPNYDVPQNSISSMPLKPLLDILGHHVTFALVDRRSARGQSILNAVGNVMNQALRIVSVQRTKPVIPPSLQTAGSSPPILSVSSAPQAPPTLLWITIPCFSLPRVLVEGLKLSTDQKIPWLTFSTALDNHPWPMPHVALLVEVQLGSIFYCGPDQVKPPSGFDSLAIVKKFTMIKEDDGSELFLPQNADSSAPLFRVFQQSQIGVVRYILHPGKE